VLNKVFLHTQSMDTALKTTPFFKYHESHQAKLAPFAGWNMPLHYADGAKAEHLWVRSSAGLFDISHMARIVISGAKAMSFLSLVTTVDLASLGPGQGAYGLVMHPDGGILDDIYLYNISESSDDPEISNRYLMVANASNHGKISSWFQAIANFGLDLLINDGELQKSEINAVWEQFNMFRDTLDEIEPAADTDEEDLQIIDMTQDWAMMALQGPKAISLWETLTGKMGLSGLLPQSKNTLLFQNLNGESDGSSGGGSELIISRTGYTGEDGVEIIGSVELLVKIWQALLETEECKAIGLAARDSLRFEPGYSLYGHEIEEDILPTEALLKWTIRKTDEAFIGAAALKEKAAGSKRILRTIRMEEKAVPRQGYAVTLEDGTVIGEVVSGMFAPSLDGFYANILIEKEKSSLDNIQYIDIRGKLKKSVIVKRPLYQAGR
jgi:glycine cleavage system aminomethyltransferase T